MKTNFLFLTMCFVSLMLNGQTFKKSTPACITADDIEYSSCTTGDLNGDGKIDIIVIGSNEVTKTPFLGVYMNGANGFTLSTISGIDSGLFHSWIDLGDYDKDGDLDIVMQGFNADGKQVAYVYRNSGTGVFVAVAELQGCSNGSIFWGDYDNDGKLDIIQSGWSTAITSGITTIYHNDGNNKFTAIISPVRAQAESQARWGDFNKDGKLDVIVMGWGKTVIYRGDAKGGFVQTNTAPDISLDFARSQCFDFDKDGFQDILITGYVAGSNPFEWATKLYRGTSDGTFEDTQIEFTGTQQGNIFWSDLNKDGFYDIVQSGWNGKGEFKVYMNDGTNNNFTATTSVLDEVTPWVGSMAVADFNGDGYDDLFQCGWWLNNIFLNANGNISIIENPKQLKDVTIIFKNRQIFINTNNLSDYKVIVFDNTGKTLIRNNYFTPFTTIRTSELSDGMYFVMVVNEEKSKVEKIIVK